MIVNPGRLLLVAGVVLAAVGLLLMFGARIPLLGRLPGDIRHEGPHGAFYFPIATCIVLSIILTIVLNVVLRLLRK